ncbi:hypothetical protein [Exiguobacterium sp. s142]|uniref:hypothetical protein n=1 Tax=Exiguobacterium sp. s142 TaxID=2751222 RepID=UPI001BE9EC32|nr:hypothetical protein [Exiguobacterium sp. s142]
MSRRPDEPSDTLDSQTAYLLRRQRQRKALHRIQSHISRHTRKGVLSWVASFIASLRETRST